jgi:hypothetical protein
MVSAMPELEESAQAKNAVPPSRGPNPAWRIALGIAIWVTGAVGAVVFVTGLTTPGGENRRSLGMAVLWVAASVSMLQGPKRKFARILLIAWVGIFLVAGYRMATS